MVNNLDDGDVILRLPGGLFGDDEYAPLEPGESKLPLRGYGYRWLRPVQHLTSRCRGRR